jgi:hypothetical protein
MALVIPYRSIDDNDYEKVIPLAQTGASITPINTRLDDGDIERKIIALQTAAGVPASRFINRKDWTKALLAVQVKLNSRTATITIASPAVVSLATHGFVAGTAIKFASTGALPTGLTVGPTYYVSATGLAAGTFQVALTAGGASVNTTGSQSGVHTVYAV